MVGSLIGLVLHGRSCIRNEKRRISHPVSSSQKIILEKQKRPSISIRLSSTIHLSITVRNTLQEHSKEKSSTLNARSMVLVLSSWMDQEHMNFLSMKQFLSWLVAKTKVKLIISGTVSYQTQVQNLSADGSMTLVGSRGKLSQKHLANVWDETLLVT